MHKRLCYGIAENTVQLSLTIGDWLSLVGIRLDDYNNTLHDVSGSKGKPRFRITGTGIDVDVKVTNIDPRGNLFTLLGHVSVILQLTENVNWQRVTLNPTICCDNKYTRRTDEYGVRFSWRREARH